MIYVVLRGRIGNQLFIYAMARQLQLKRGRNEEIVIDDEEVRKLGWIDSLEKYQLDHVRFVHNHGCCRLSIRRKFIYWMYLHAAARMDFWTKYRFEKRCRGIFEKNGLILCENGYMDLYSDCRDILIDGYFQSELYFKEYKDRIKQELRLSLEGIDYPGLEQLRRRNSVCISIKVEHNIGSALYDVCSLKYWKEAIACISGCVEEPLFFICSDNVEYVRKNIIDCSRYDTVYQSLDFPAEISLAVMSCCRHFIIGNTTFGWWAQYLSDYEKKTVIAPKTWMLADMPVHIYQDHWIKLEVS